jgi:hypothetical protein
MADGDKKKKRLSRGKIATTHMRTTGGGALATQAGNKGYAGKLYNKVKKFIKEQDFEKGYKVMKKKIDQTKATSKF